MNLDLISNKIEIKYYNNLIKYCKETNNDYAIFSNQLVNLQEINDTVTESENTLSKLDNDTSESKEVIYSDDYLYKKPWIKLSNVHKIIKIKEFVSKLLIYNKDDKDNLKKELVRLITIKYLTKKDKVKYDSSNGRVIAIPILSFKNGTYIINKDSK